MKPPPWAMRLLAEVCPKRTPPLRWAIRRSRHSTGKYDLLHDGGHDIYISAGHDYRDTRVAVIHEGVHARLGEGALDREGNHGAAFWRAFRNELAHHRLLSYARRHGRHYERKQLAP